MKIKKFSKNATLPTKSHNLDCGLDVYLPEDITIKPFKTLCIGLGIGFEIPEGCAGQFVPRSSIAKKGMIIHPAIVDPGYTGEVHLIVTNCSNNTLIFEKGNRLGSLVLYNIINPVLDVVDNLPNSERGSAGLGSSGK